MLGYGKNKEMIKPKQYILGFKVNKTFWITLYEAKNYFWTILPVILQLFIKSGPHGWRARCIWTVNFKRLQEVEFHSIKIALSCLRKSLETENSLKMLENAFHLKHSSRSHDIKFLSWIFSHVEKRLD